LRIRNLKCRHMQTVADNDFLPQRTHGEDWFTHVLPLLECRH
jgi:hypothetical protein